MDQGNILGLPIRGSFDTLRCVRILTSNFCTHEKKFALARPLMTCKGNSFLPRFQPSSSSRTLVSGNVCAYHSISDTPPPRHQAASAALAFLVDKECIQS